MYDLEVYIIIYTYSFASVLEGMTKWVVSDNKLRLKGGQPFQLRKFTTDVVVV